MMKKRWIIVASIVFLLSFLVIFYLNFLTTPQDFLLKQGISEDQIITESGVKRDTIFVFYENPHKNGISVGALNKRYLKWNWSYNGNVFVNDTDEDIYYHVTGQSIGDQDYSIIFGLINNNLIDSAKIEITSIDGPNVILNPQVKDYTNSKFFYVIMDEPLKGASLQIKVIPNPPLPNINTEND
ncbi:hypothetical protein ABDI30_21475 [Paenibacillus cisolokensis]|uniref:hypothetical protein n=1 Tax=Paenibacillus cisolokensis TaxID=1658519 RepID=UPI003D2D6F5B